MNNFEKIRERMRRPIEWLEMVYALNGLRHRMQEFKSSNLQLYFFPSNLNDKNIISDDEYSGNKDIDDSDKLSVFDFDWDKYLQSWGDNDYHYDERKQLSKSNTISVIIITHEIDYKFFHEITKEDWIEFNNNDKSIILEIEKAFKYVF